MASSSAASLPGRNECPGTHYSLIVKEEKEKTVFAKPARECEIKEKEDGGEDRVARTEREAKKKKIEQKW